MTGQLHRLSPRRRTHSYPELDLAARVFLCYKNLRLNLAGSKSLNKGWIDLANDNTLDIGG